MSPEEIKKLKKIRKLVNELLGDAPVTTQDGPDEGSGEGGGDLGGTGGGPGEGPGPRP